MESTRYLIVGGGMTGDAAVKGIREHDVDGSIVLVGAEQHPPYARPPLTKGLWAGTDEAKIWRGTEETGAVLRLGRRIVSLDLDGHRATDDRGDEYRWEKLLLATGGRPRTIPGTDGVVYYRTLDDYRAVRARVHDGARVVVIGGGFIGSELAASLAANGCRVTMIFPERGIASRVLPSELSAYVTEEYRDRGVEVLTEETVAAAGATWVTTGSGRTIEADVVAAGLGLEPATDLARPPGSRSTTASSSTSWAVWQDTTTSSPPATSQASRSRRSDAASGSSTRTTRSHMAAWSGRTWRARTSRTSTCRSSTPTCST